MEQWKIRLREAREAKGMNKTEFARAVGVSNPTVTDWEKSSFEGGIKEISGTKLTRACAVLGVDPTWLLSGKGTPPTKDGSFNLTPVRTSSDDDGSLVVIPKVRLVLSAGVTGYGVEPEPYDGTTTTVPAEWVKRRQLNPQSLVAIRVRGRSMENTFHEGDLVIINREATEAIDGAVFAINYEGEDVLKRMSRDAGDWWLTSDNPNQQQFPRKVCRGSACIIIGRVVRSEKEH
jgi:phage repressor protein C with HTH and peptisase S24 domain